MLVFVVGESQRGIDVRIPKRTKHITWIWERTYFNCKMRMTLFELLFVMVQGGLAGVPWSTRGSRCGYPLCPTKTLPNPVFRRCVSRLVNRSWCLWRILSAERDRNSFDSTVRKKCDARFTTGYGEKGTRGVVTAPQEWQTRPSNECRGRGRLNKKW